MKTVVTTTVVCHHCRADIPTINGESMGKIVEVGSTELRAQFDPVVRFDLCDDCLPALGRFFGLGLDKDGDE